MLTKERVRKMDMEALMWNAKDLQGVIGAQEPFAREHGMESCPKLGVYYDELLMVAEEIQRRRGPKVPRCPTCHQTI